MAIGIPVRKQQIKTAANGRLPMRLEYPGKQTVAEILATPPAQLKTLWHGSFKDNDNRLYFGENLSILAALLNNSRVAGKVQLIYIDPPFSTQSLFQSRNLTYAYEDTLSGYHFIEFLRARLVLLRELLADTGSIYLHLDEKMVFQIKVIMDEVFGEQNYKNCIVRKKCNPKNYTRKQYGNISDYILFYTKSENYIWNRPMEKWTEDRAAKEYQYTDPKTCRRYKKMPLHAPGVRQGETGKPWRGIMPPPGKHWQYTPRKLDELDARGDIYWSSNGNPLCLVYFDESHGVAIQDIWLDFRDAHNQNIKITGYPTEKNPFLIQRIIEASSNPGDLVLDCFSGSGTTLSVSSNLGRKWIGIDKSKEAICTTLQRFSTGTDFMGDFVKSPVEKNPNLSLFNTPSCPPSTIPNAHIDFTLLAEQDCADEFQKKGGLKASSDLFSTTQPR
jgi:adenine-specific DNA-methyltransferase